jgi:hypothetical protein
MQTQYFGLFAGSRRIRFHGAAILVASFLTLAMARQCRADPPPNISVGQCLEHGGSTNEPDESPIRSCCLNGVAAKGCYICDSHWANCVWDSGYSRIFGTISNEMTGAIAEYRAQHGIKTESEAIRQLLELGLKAERKR